MVTEWRKELRRQWSVGRVLERVANRYDVPFEVRPHWPGLDWIVHSGSIAEFAEMVRVATDAIGRKPDEVKGEYWLGCFGDDDPPDLIARWNIPTGDEILKTARITVRCLHPSGCRLDGSHVRETTPKLDPRCAGVLEEIAAYEPSGNGAD